MTNFEKECVAFVSGYMEAGVSAEDYVKAFAERLLDVARDELNSRQGVKVESVNETLKNILVNDLKDSLLEWAMAHKSAIEINGEEDDAYTRGEYSVLNALIDKLESL